LSSKEQKLLVDIIDSLREMFEAVAEGISANQSEAIDILLECLASLVRIDMCTFAVMLVLEGEIMEWDARAIKLLCYAAEQYMLEMEDVSLIHDKELESRLRERMETISLQQVRKQIGLSS
jgi:PAS domain-containing protein